MYYLENNIVMNYSDIFNFFIIILVIISMLTIFIKMPFHIILTSKVVNKDIKIDLNLRYMFNLINVNINIYPKEIEFKKKELKQSKIKRKVVENLKRRKFFLKDILNVYSELKKIEIEEFYSNIHIGNTNIAITNFAYLFINLVYGNLINIIDSNKFYMNIKPNFIENKIYIDFKIHLKPTIKNIIDILKAIIITYKKAKT